MPPPRRLKRSHRTKARLAWAGGPGPSPRGRVKLELGTTSFQTKQREWIERDTRAAHLETEVQSCAVAGRCHQSDHLSRHHGVARLDERKGERPVCGAQALIAIDDDVQA